MNTDNAKSVASVTQGRLFVLDLSGGRIFSTAPDGTDSRTIVTGCRHPDGIVVTDRHIYWTNMGASPSVNDGSIERVDHDGRNRATIVAEGQTFTPKQLQYDAKSALLYWADREGMRVMRAALDGSRIETLIDSSEGEVRPGRDPRKWCVGVAVDSERGYLYWTQKGPDNAGQGRIFRAAIDVPRGETAATRRDIEVLFEGLPEPIDLELATGNRVLYWTDRGDPPRGNTVNRASVDLEKGNRPEPEILCTHLMEGIGLVLDRRGGRMYVSDMGGSVYTADLEGKGYRPILVAQGNLAGLAYREMAP